MRENSDTSDGYLATELGVFPREWEIKKLGDIVTLETGKRMKGGGLETGDVASIGGEHINGDGTITLKNPKFITQDFYDNLRNGKVQLNDVLLVKDGATTGKIAFINEMLRERLAINEHVFILRSKNHNELHNHFLFFILFSEIGQDQIELRYHGLIGGINREEMKDLSIPLPPLPEQHAIATTLSIVQEAKEKTNAVIAATKALKAAMMKHLFRYGPVPPEETEQVALNETEIGQVPEGWEISTLGKIAHVGNGSTPKRDNPAYWENGTIPWITSTRVHDSIITEADFFVTELAIRECHLPLVKEGSLVVAITGQGKTLGNTALVAFDTRINQHLAYVEFNDDSVVAEFMLRFMQSRYQQLRDVSHSAGSTKGALTCGFLKTYPVPLPSKDVQIQIAQTLSVLDQKLVAEQSRKQALDTLFSTLLHDLMTAKIRVNAIAV